MHTLPRGLTFARFGARRCSLGIVLPAQDGWTGPLILKRQIAWEPPPPLRRPIIVAPSTHSSPPAAFDDAEAAATSLAPSSNPNPCPTDATRAFREQFHALVAGIRLHTEALPFLEKMDDTVDEVADSDKSLEVSNEGVGSPGNNFSGFTCASMTPGLVVELYRAADAAHTLLEQIFPALSPRHPGFFPPEYGEPFALQAFNDRPFDIEDPVFARQAVHDVLAAWAFVSRADFHCRRHSAESSSPLSSSRASKAKGGEEARRLMRGIPQRAEFLLDRLEVALSSSDDSSTPPPSIDFYNLVLDAWAHSSEHRRGTIAERLFRRLPHLQPPRRPDAATHRLTLWAWANSDDPRAAFAATGHLMKMFRLLEHGTVAKLEPTLSDCHAVLRAWTKAEDKNSPHKALSVLKLMEQAYRRQLTAVRPDLECYRSVLLAAANRPLLPDLGPLVDAILRQMWHHRFVVPDAQCFAAAVRTWKHSALLYAGSPAAPATVSRSLSTPAKAVTPDNALRERSVRRARELLDDTAVAHQQRTGTGVRPPLECVHDVLEALAVSSNPRALEWASRALRHLPSGPTLDTYCLLLGVCRATAATGEPTPSAAAAERSEAILGDVAGSFLQLVRHLPPRRAQRRAAAFAASYVRACAGDPTGGLPAFRRALAGVEKLRSLSVHPNSETYAALLDACHRLLPQGLERHQLVRQVFLLCRSEGSVDETVLRELRVASTEDQFAELVLSECEFVEGTKMIPESWTANALSGRVLTAEGRRTPPLSVEGRLTVTLAMREFQMRRLRDHRNRNLLQGGRLCNLPDYTEKGVQ